MYMTGEKGRVEEEMKKVCIQHCMNHSTVFFFFFLFSFLFGAGLYSLYSYFLYGLVISIQLVSYEFVSTLFKSVVHNVAKTSVEHPERRRGKAPEV